MVEYRFYRLRLGVEVIGLKLWGWDLKLKHLSVKTTNNERFECSSLKNWLFLYHLAEKNMIKRPQLRLLCLDNNLFEKNTC